MAYPAGVTVRSLSFSPVTDAEDGSEPATSTRIIVSCNDLLVHTATGRILLPSAQIFTAATSLPVTDQEATWQNTLGEVATSPTHSYHVSMEQKFTVDDEVRWELVKCWPKLLLPASGGALDLDTYFDGLSTNYTPG